MGWLLTISIIQSSSTQPRPPQGHVICMCTSTSPVLWSSDSAFVSLVFVFPPFFVRWTARFHFLDSGVGTSGKGSASSDGNLGRVKLGAILSTAGVPHNSCVCPRPGEKSGAPLARICSLLGCSCSWDCNSPSLLSSFACFLTHSWCMLVRLCLCVSRPSVAVTLVSSKTKARSERAFRRCAHSEGNKRLRMDSVPALHCAIRPQSASSA